MHRQSRRKLYVKSVSLDFAGDGASECNGRSPVEINGRENNGGSPSSLLPASLWIEIQPNQIAGIRHVRAYQTSAPRGGLQAYSPRLSPSSNPSSNSSSVRQCWGTRGWLYRGLHEGNAAEPVWNPFHGFTNRQRSLSNQFFGNLCHQGVSHANYFGRHRAAPVPNDSAN